MLPVGMPPPGCNQAVAAAVAAAVIPFTSCLAPMPPRCAPPSASLPCRTPCHVCPPTRHHSRAACTLQHAGAKCCQRREPYIAALAQCDAHQCRAQAKSQARSAPRPGPRRPPPATRACRRRRACTATIATRQREVTALQRCGSVPDAAMEAAAGQQRCPAASTSVAEPAAAAASCAAAVPCPSAHSLASSSISSFFWQPVDGNAMLSFMVKPAGSGDSTPRARLSGRTRASKQAGARGAGRCLPPPRGPTLPHSRCANWGPQRRGASRQGAAGASAMLGGGPQGPPSPVRRRPWRCP